MVSDAVVKVKIPLLLKGAPVKKACRRGPRDGTWKFWILPVALLVARQSNGGKIPVAPLKLEQAASGEAAIGAAICISVLAATGLFCWFSSGKMGLGFATDEPIFPKIEVFGVASTATNVATVGNPRVGFALRKLWYSALQIVLASLTLANVFGLVVAL